MRRNLSKKERERLEQLFIEKTKKFTDAELALICNRAALRILPLVYMETVRPVDKLSPEYFVLDLFRALLVSRYLILEAAKANSLKAPAINIEKSLADLSQILYKKFDFTARTDQVHIAGSLNMARITADACLNSLRWAIRLRWFFKIDASPEKYYEISGEEEYFKLVEQDIKLITEMRMSASDLYLQPLWEPGGTEYLEENWSKLKKTLLKSDENWNGWIDWYENLILGLPINIDQEYEVAAIIDKHIRSDFHKPNKFISDMLAAQNWHNETSKIRKKFKFIVHSIRRIKFLFESRIRMIYLYILRHLKHMGGGNVVAGIAVVLTIITAILAFAKIV